MANGGASSTSTASTSTTAPRADVARRIHQIRDAVLRVDDPVGGGRGWCNFQTAIVGEWPDDGLDEESSFV